MSRLRTPKIRERSDLRRFIKINDRKSSFDGSITKAIVYGRIDIEKTDMIQPFRKWEEIVQFGFATCLLHCSGHITVVCCLLLAEHDGD